MHPEFIPGHSPKVVNVNPSGHNSYSILC